MNKRILMSVLFVALMAVSGSPSASTSQVATDKGATGGEDVAKAPPQPKYPITDFEGVVTAVDDRSISVRGFGARVCCAAQSWSDETGYKRISLGPKMTVSFPDREERYDKVVFTRESLTLTSPDGKVTVLRRADEPTRRFPADAVLAAGAFHADELPGNTYRLADVRVGDEVHIRMCRERHDGLCYAISICRRPGGRVPPAPGEGPNPLPHPFHEMMNAEQDSEERGVPIPEKFLSRWQREQRAARIAPPPREAIPRIPPAKD